MHLGEMLRAWRIYYEISQHALAKQIGVDANIIFRLEKHQNIKADSLALVVIWILQKVPHGLTHQRGDPHGGVEGGYMMLTPTQLRMARAALNLSLRTLGALLGLSAMALSRYEQGDTRAISVATATRILAYCQEHQVHLGPQNGVCVGTNVFWNERWLGLACFQLLQEHDIHPSSAELLEAAYRAKRGVAPHG